MPQYPPPNPPPPFPSRVGPKDGGRAGGGPGGGGGGGALSPRQQHQSKQRGETGEHDNTKGLPSTVEDFTQSRAGTKIKNHLKGEDR